MWTKYLHTGRIVEGDATFNDGLWPRSQDSCDERIVLCLVLLSMSTAIDFSLSDIMNLIFRAAWPENTQSVLVSTSLSRRFIHTDSPCRSIPYSFEPSDTYAICNRFLPPVWHWIWIYVVETSGFLRPSKVAVKRSSEPAYFSWGHSFFISASRNISGIVKFSPWLFSGFHWKCCYTRLL
jgi:hypothetical protein